MKKKMLPNHQKSGFKVPENYFGDFEVRLIDRLNEPEVLDGTFMGQPGFNVPENYFNRLEKQVLDKIGEKNDTTKVIPLFRKKKLYYAAAIAAVFTGIISTLFFKAPGADFTIDSLELSALENYLDDEYINIDNKEISVFMIDDSYSFYNFSTSRLSDEAVFQYISENIEDPNLLFE